MQYIDTVTVIMDILLSRDVYLSTSELLQLLAPYRKIIWKREDSEAQKQGYYLILSNQAKMAGRQGEMLYYAEKINELDEQRYRQPSVNSLTFMADYYNNNSAYRNTRALYEKHKIFIHSLPRMVARDTLRAKEVERIGKMLCYFATATYTLQDTVAGNTLSGLLDRIREVARTRYGSDASLLANLKYVQLLVLYEKGLALSDNTLVYQTILDLERLAAGKQTPETLRSYIEFTAMDKKIVYYLEAGNTDSAGYYLKEFQRFHNKKDNPYINYMTTKYTARSLYNRGLYKQSIDTLLGAIVLMEKMRATAVTEINDIVYALAKLEDQQLLLEDTREKQRKSDRRLLYTGSGFVLLLLGGLYTVRVMRYRQMEKFLEFKLNLARNIHDEANPALLYAKALASSERRSQGITTKTALESQIENTMELLRSLSHDLRSARQHSVAELTREVRDLLQKLNPDNAYSYYIRKDIEEHLFLSHFQYTQILAILKECISNTLKHADFRQIDIALSRQQHTISITYRDDGPGWPPQTEDRGIGLENMKTRAAKMNASFQLHNNYPEGYYIQLISKLH